MWPTRIGAGAGAVPPAVFLANAAACLGRQEGGFSTPVAFAGLTEVGAVILLSIGLATQAALPAR